MWVKTTCCNSSLSFFNQKLLFTMYQCSPLPVRRLQPAESYNSLSFSSSPGRELQPPQLLRQPRYQYVGAGLQKATTFSVFQGPHFINFQTGSMNIKQSSRNSSSTKTPFHQLDLKSSRYFSASCTQNTVPDTTQQNPEHSSNKQKQLDHNLKHIRNFNSLQLACIRICVWNNLRIRAFTSLKQRVYAPSLY